MANELSPYMRRALELASQARGETSPNPPVGAVVVKDGAIVGEGRTQPPGQAHAEVVALRQAGERARGATLYVTLEPCCHFGRTPPCTREIIQAGIREVHFSLVDPNPTVSGRGHAELQAAGLGTHVGEGAQEARELVEAHSKFVTTRLPFVTGKVAMSLDGKIATRTGDSRWISGEESRRMVHEMRRASDALLVGVNTVLRDDPQLTARDAEGRPYPRQPLRVVVDSQGRTPVTARLFQGPGGTAVACTDAVSPAREEQLLKAGAQVLRMPAREGRVDLQALLQALGRRQHTSVLVEGGGTLLGALFDAGLVDKLVVFIAPLVIGGRDAPTAVQGTGAATLAQAIRLRRTRVVRYGDDLAVTAYLAE